MTRWKSWQKTPNSHMKPMMEYVLSGLRTEMVSLRGQLGFMDLDKKNIPPHVWNIIEAGFELFTELEEKLEKVNILATEAQEVVVMLVGC